MTKKEYAERNIGMTFDFIRHIIEQPAIIDTIPDNAELDFIDKDMPVKSKERVEKKNIARYKVERVFEPMKE
ncbi:MAG: hypothetical protein DCC43_15825 [Candidatus Brocadia sp.]|jgi:hypothetical protein|nr:MAG: hypothetical protein DCC43_15825 [Candidatus Brocadia sp.]